MIIQWPVQIWARTVPFNLFLLCLPNPMENCGSHGNFDLLLSYSFKTLLGFLSLKPTWEPFMRYNTSIPNILH